MAVRSKDEKKIIRPFGNVECYEFHMLQLKFLGSTIVNSRYTIPSSLAASESVVARVEDAIARVVIEHPALRLDVVDADTKRPAWVAVDELDFTHHVTWEDVDDTSGNYEEIFRDKIEKRLDEPYTNLAGRPQWRVLILFKKGDRPYLDIIFDYSHAFSDGTSGKIFHETLLRTLNATPETEKQTPILTNRILKIPSSAPPLPPPVEKIGKFPVTPKFAISTAWRELRPAGLITSPSAAHAHWAPIRATPYATRFRTFDIEAGTLRNILTACRAHKTTVTGLLHALVVASMAARIKPATAFTGSTALDLRKFLETSADLEPKRTMADYVSQMAHVFSADLVREIREAAVPVVSGDVTLPPPLADIIWRSATRVRAEIQKRLDNGLKNDLVGLMRLVSDWRAQFRTEASKPRPYSFVITNLGVLDGSLDTIGAKEKREGEEKEEKDGGWTIEHAVFAISAEVCGAAFQVSPISVKNGALCVSCSWQECVVEAELGEAIVADLKRWLLFLGES
ncbi:alcohol acetyltransferase-domain-containing protein [Xylaria curta]|nr:alcohol acetyltransferase-domain-containing protein [Xylaria curta]